MLPTWLGLLKPLAHRLEVLRDLIGAIADRARTQRRQLQ